MPKTLTVGYDDIYGNPTVATLTGNQLTITETNPGITSPISDVVTGTVLTEVPINVTTTLYGVPSAAPQTSTLATVTLKPDLNVLPLELSGLQLPSSTSTTTSSSSALSELSTVATTSQSSTATSSPSSSTSRATSGSSGKAFHSGDIAGAAAGCLVGGALIAGLVVWLFMSSRHKKQRFRGGFANERHTSSNVNREKSLPTAPTLAAGAGWEQHLPQSESDGTIRTSVKALFNQIELHVENFYRNAAVSISPEIRSQLTQVDSSQLPDSVVGLLPQTSTPTMLIKHCLAALIVSRITPETDTSASFLPADFVALPLAMGGTRTSANNKPVFAQALSRWRVLTSYLRPQAQDDRAYVAQRDANIGAAADTFGTAFAPWAGSPADLQVRRQHLVNLMKAATDMGIMIFAQPSSFAYRWTVPSERDRRGLTRIVVLPGFAKVTDEHARDLGGRAQELVAPVFGTL